MAIGVLALVGTRKGLFLLRGDDNRRSWRMDGPLLCPACPLAGAREILVVAMLAGG
jgi:hypothetical protein